MSHTPGPWEILRLDLGDEEICSVPVAIRGGNGRLVVDNEGGLAPEAYEWTVEEIEANASLIAAAPELLEALKEIKARLEVYDPTCPFCGGNASSGHRYTCLWHVANAALREARGEV